MLLMKRWKKEKKVFLMIGKKSNKRMLSDCFPLRSKSAANAGVRRD